MSIVLETKNLSKAFGGLKATDNVSFQLQAGARHALIGPNGAGKTTVLNIATGVYKPDAGQVLVNGHDVTSLRPYERSRLGLSRTFQGGRPFGQLTARENIQIAIEQRQKIERAGRFEPSPVQNADALLDEIGLLGEAALLAKSLPYGKQKQLEIARAIAYATSVMLLDEPTSGLSLEEIDLVLSVVAKYRSKLAILLVEHNMDVVMAVCNQIVVIDAGCWIAAGEPKEIQVNPQVVNAYLGT